MRTSFAILLLSAFVGIAVFGVFSMNMNHGAHVNCIAATIAGASCPDGNNSWAMLGFHFDAFKNFSGATFASSVLGIFFLVLVLEYGWLYVPQFPFSPERAFASPAERSLFAGERIRYWLSLHENSPNTL